LSDLNTRTPSGGDVTQRTDTKPAFSIDLLEQVLSSKNLQAACRVLWGLGARYPRLPDYANNRSN